MELNEAARELIGAGADEYFPPKDAPEGYFTRIRIDSIGGQGPWVG